jgi:hypothetical protein
MSCWVTSGDLGDLPHGQRPVGLLAENGEDDMVAVRYAGVALQLAVERLLQQNGGEQVGPPGFLLLVVQPPWSVHYADA